MGKEGIAFRFIVTDIKELSGKPGIYAIVNKTNNHLYIGQSHDLLKRKREHFKSLKNNKHSNAYLQNSYNLYGKDNFGFFVIEYVARLQDLNDREQYWIERLMPDYNIRKNVYGPLYETRKRKKDDVPVLMVGEEYIRPEWHKWVYGGQKRNEENTVTNLSK